jgi:nucleoside-diphosphate-sugar epimerase
MAKILLTGAAGFVGRALLAEAGVEHEWTAMDLGFPESWHPVPSVTESVVSDLSDPVSLRAVVERTRPDAVVHLAGWTGKGGSKENRAKLLAANLVSTWNLLDAIVSGGEDRPVQFLLASSALVYGDQPGPFRETFETRPPDEYALTKWLAEEVVRASARSGSVLPTVIRPAVIYGPGQNGAMFVPSLARALAKGEPFPMTAGAQKRDLVHVGDVARAILALLRVRAQGVFNVGTGTGIPMLEIGRKMAEMSGRPDLLRVGSIPYRDKEVWDYAVDATRLEAATGWKPRTSLDEGLEETLKKERNL